MFAWYLFVVVVEIYGDSTSVNYYTLQIDQKFQPCENVQKHFCGKWLKKMENQTNVFGIQQTMATFSDTINSITKAVLSVNVTDKKLQPYQKSTYGYLKECLSFKNGTLEERVKKLLDGLIQSVGRPTCTKVDHSQKKSLWYLLGQWQREMPTGSFVKVDSNRVELNCSSTEKPNMLVHFKMEDMLVTRGQYKDTQDFMDIVKHLGHAINSSALNCSLDKLVQLESELKNLSDTYFDKENLSDALVFLKDVPSSGMKFIQDYFKGLFPEDKFSTWSNGNPHFYTHNEQQWKRLDKVLNKFPETTIFNYIFYNTLVSYYVYVKGYREVDDETLNTFCYGLMSTYLSAPTTSIFFQYQKWNISDWRQDIETVGKNTLKAMIDSVKRTNIPDNSDKDLLLKNLTQITYKSGLPIWLGSTEELNKRTLFYNYNLSLVHNFQNEIMKQTLNSFITSDGHGGDPMFDLDPNLHICDNHYAYGLLASLPPLYDFNYPVPTKYGYLGYLMIRDSLTMFAKDSHPPKNRTMEWIGQHEKCLENQTSPYCQNQSVYCNFDQNNSLEKLFDISSTVTAYEAYKLSHKTSGSRDSDQMFFVANALTICRQNVEKRSGPYGAEEINPTTSRVAISFRNNEVFNNVFQCRKNIKSCRILD